MRISPTGFVFTAWKARDAAGEGERVYSLPVSCCKPLLPTEVAVSISLALASKVLDFKLTNASVVSSLTALIVTSMHAVS